MICETKTLLEVNKAVWSLTSSTVLCIGPSLSPNFCKQLRPAFSIVPHITYNPSIYFNINALVIINCNKKCPSGVVNSHCQSRNSLPHLQYLTMITGACKCIIICKLHISKRIQLYFLYNPHDYLLFWHLQWSPTLNSGLAVKQMHPQTTYVELG